MPDSDYRPDEESEELARKLAQSTIEDIRRFQESSSDLDTSTVSLERHAGELGIDTPLRDATFVMQEFAWQWHLARQFGGSMLCVQIGDDEQAETVPLSSPLDYYWPFPGPSRSWRMLRRYFPFPLEYLFEAYQDSLRSHAEIEGATLESVDNVLERIQEGLGSFLAYRISGFRDWVELMLGRQNPRPGGSAGGGARGGRGRSGRVPPPSSSPGGGVGVEFSCITAGLTIEFSHAYFIHFLNFGAPSTPVTNTLLAGRYVFKGTGPTFPSGTSRSQIFRIPPDYKAKTTVF